VTTSICCDGTKKVFRRRRHPTDTINVFSPAHGHTKEMKMFQKCQRTLVGVPPVRPSSTRYYTSGITRSTNSSSFFFLFLSRKKCQWRDGCFLESRPGPSPWYLSYWIFFCPVFKERRRRPS
jgi:hypothetical protein